MQPFSSYLKVVFSKLNSTRQEGVALIVSLLVTLVLVLLALSLLLQSSTDQLVAVNEQDSFRSLAFAESGLEIVNRQVKTYASSFPAPTDLDEVLNGPDDASAADDFLPELSGFRTLDISLTPANFDNSNETTTSVKTTFEGEDWEVFRLGDDADGDGAFDGNVRALVYLRVEDNYDTLNDTDDTDFRMVLHVMADYPVFVNGDGEPDDSPIKQRGVARRRLLGRFEPAGRTAIRTDGDLIINGSLEVCGACGGVHANENLDVNGSVAVCGQATGTGSAQVLSGDVDVRGGVGVTGEVFIPVINPYDNRYVPVAGTFFTANDPDDADPDSDVPSYLECPGPGVTNTNYLTVDPGASKYFAITFKKQAGSGFIRVWKAYWDTTGAHWVWRLIDDSEDGTLDAVLDNCGRLVSSAGLGLTADPIPDGSDSAYWVTGRPAWVGVGRADGGNNEFYGFRNSNGNPGNYDVRNPVCTTDESLTTVAWNDYAQTNWARIVGGNPWDDGAGDTDITDAGDWAYTDPTGTLDPILPGTAGNMDTAIPPTGYATTDGNMDFIYQDALEEGRNEIRTGTGQDIYSPVWGAVLWVYGNLFLNGGSNISYINDAGAATTSDIGGVDDRWRISFISFNNIDVAGNPIFGPASENFYVTFVTGRDVEMNGTPSAGHGNQDQCPDMSAGTDCTLPPGNTPGFEGMVLTHEECNFHGNVTLDGFIIAEDAATCSNMRTGETIATGSVQIHYDCEHPPDPWGNRSVQLVSWEEVQQ